MSGYPRLINQLKTTRHCTETCGRCERELSSDKFVFAKLGHNGMIKYYCLTCTQTKTGFALEQARNFSMLEGDIEFRNELERLGLTIQEEMTVA